MQHAFISTGKLTLLVAAAVLLPGAQPRLAGLDGRLLDSHNRERALAGVPALRWNPQLAEGAQAWADHLSLTGKFEHSPNLPGRRPEGENIWGGTAGAFRPESMVNLWIAEKEYFVPGVFPANSRTGRAEDVAHYTQVIWGQSLEVGCGLSQQGHEEILVCRYSAPGNIRGRDPFSRAAAKTGRQDQSTFRFPRTASAAGFAESSSARMGGAIGAVEIGAADDAGLPPGSSARRRDVEVGAPVNAGTSPEYGSKSIILTICGWSSINCSWLID